MRVSFEEMLRELNRVLLSHGFSEAKAQRCAWLFTIASRDGVYSHGLNRFPRFISYIQKGYINIHEEPQLIRANQHVEQWDGMLGPGNLNAWFAMERAIDLAKVYGLSMVTLRNTNHWMRGGNYGWQAVNEGCIGICWTNTLPNMPAWGAAEPVIGNNPLIVGIPRTKGHVVLDIAMSQFSFGKMESYKLKGEPLPMEGGFDAQGNLTKDPSIVEQTGMALPFGYWKGSGLSIVLDILAASLSLGQATFEVGRGGDEYGLSQLFIAINPSSIGMKAFADQKVNEIVDFIHQAKPLHTDGEITFPGERTLRTRMENLSKGIPVDETYWNQILKM